MQNEIKQKGPLLDSNGELTQKGYAKTLILDYDRKAVKANKSRIKEWDYYLITSNDFALALTVDDNGYMGMMSASVLDFSVPFEKTSSVIIPFTFGKVKMPPSSKTGDVAFKNKKVDFSFENNVESRILKVTYNGFDKSETLKAEIELTEIPPESMVIATPFAENKKAFYYNQKIVAMRAEGYMEYKGKRYEFSRDNNSFGMLDWGRGVWTYDNTWLWSAGQTEIDGKAFGFNIGYGFGDTTAASENMLFYDGVAHKLDRLTFNIPKSSDGTDDYMSPWTFTSSDGRFEMDFVPVIDRKSKISVAVIESDQHQVFGKFSGKAILDDGTVIEVKDMMAFAEKVRNKW